MAVRRRQPEVPYAHELSTDTDTSSDEQSCTAGSGRRAARSASSATPCCASGRAEVSDFDRGLRKLAKRMIRIMHDAPGRGPGGAAGRRAAAPARLRRRRRPARAGQPRARRVLGGDRGERRGLPQRARRHHAGGALAQRARARAATPAASRWTYVAEGLEARVIQHEIDHLDGVLIVDRTSRSARAAALRELRERDDAGVAGAVGGGL